MLMVFTSGTMSQPPASSHTASVRPLAWHKKTAEFKIVTNLLNTLITQYILSLYIIFAPEYLCLDQNIISNNMEYLLRNSVLDGL
jgi:hypothetical protein